MSASPETRAARKTRGGFACCSRRATHTQSEAGDVQTDPLSPIKPEEAAEATVLVVEAVIAEEGEATVDVEPEDATPDVSRASTRFVTRPRFARVNESSSPRLLTTRCRGRTSPPWSWS